MPKGKGYSSKSNEDKIKAAVKSGKLSKKSFKVLGLQGKLAESPIFWSLKITFLALGIL